MNNQILNVYNASFLLKMWKIVLIKEFTEQMMIYMYIELKYINF